ncbi:MAG: zinc-dependent metalloprotease, partial [Solirubrobacterales bacterium]|nr:zinc-dependent metalloprotease [Solirubrobacterales bacterium]
PETALPAPEWIDRGAWSRANLTALSSMLDPLAEKAQAMGGMRGPSRAVTGLVATAEAGALLGLVGRRVLGQYDLALLDASIAPRLLFVGPNLAEAARALDAPADDLLSWVALHEVTHAVQFAAVPWLREHLSALLRELLDGLQLRVRPEALLRLPRAADLRGLLDAVREGGLAGIAIGRERKGLFERVQATMALVEGHAEWTMDAAAEGFVPSLPLLRSALDRRRTERPPVMRLLDRLLGLELKLKQYAEGRRFCDAVVEARGPEALRLAWRSPEHVPTIAELRAPATWLARTGA